MTTPREKLDSYFKGYEWNYHLPRFVEGFFGKDRTWTYNALKCVLPNVSEEDLQNATYELWAYEQHHSLDLEKYKAEESKKKADEVLDDFFTRVFNTNRKKTNSTS